MTVAIDVRARYSQARAEVLRQGLQLAGRADRCVPHRLTAASRLANDRRLLGGLAVCRISSARRHRARAVRCGPAVDRPGCDELGGPARRSDPHCGAAGFLRCASTATRSVIPSATRPSAAAGCCTPPPATVAMAAKTSDIAYGPDTRDNLLDIWRHRDIKVGDRAPVLLQIPGGAWTVNGRRPQGYPLMGRMAELGWVCVSIDYSKSPRKSWPAHIIDTSSAHWPGFVRI